MNVATNNARDFGMYDDEGNFYESFILEEENTSDQSNPLNTIIGDSNLITENDAIVGFKDQVRDNTEGVLNRVLPDSTSNNDSGKPSGSDVMVDYKDQVRGRRDQTVMTSRSGAKNRSNNRDEGQGAIVGAIGIHGPQLTTNYNSSIHDQDDTILLRTIPGNNNNAPDDNVTSALSVSQSVFMAQAYPVDSRVLVAAHVDEPHENDGRNITEDSIPPSRSKQHTIRNRVLLVSITLVVVVTAVLVSILPCWSGSCDGKTSSERNALVPSSTPISPSTASLPPATAPVTPSTTSLSPSTSPISPSPTNFRIPFAKESDLFLAVDLFLSDKNSTELLKYGQIENWDVSAISNFEFLFDVERNANAASFDEDIGSWNVSSGTNMYGMFDGCSNFNADLSRWDVSSVKDMSYMFRECLSFNSDISRWVVSSVIDMHNMFNDAVAFSGDLSNWDVSSVEDMRDMFAGSVSFKSNISRWVVSSVLDMQFMFNGAVAFNGDISDWDVSSVKNMDAMFGNSNFNSDISRWNVSSVIDTSGMFYFALGFDSDISRWDVSSVEIMDSMFEGAVEFNSDISKWDVSAAKRMDNMFNGATSFDANLSLWNVSQVERMDYMFAGAQSFQGIGLDAWDVSNVNHTEGMFIDAIVFDSNLSKWDVSNVLNMTDMFRNTVKFQGFGLQFWKVDQSVVTSGMFCDASGLQRKYVMSWNESLDDALC